MEQHRVERMVWPSLSPDMNPIEHLWDQLYRLVRNRAQPPSTNQELRQALMEEWQNMPINNVRNLIGGMRKRIVALSETNRGHTHY